MVRTLAHNMLTMDEPDHARLRGIVDEAFRRRQRKAGAIAEHRSKPYSGDQARAKVGAPREEPLRRKHLQIC